MDDMRMLEWTKSILRTTKDISDRVNKNVGHLDNYISVVGDAFYEEEQCDSLEDFMKRIYNRGHCVYALRHPEEDKEKYFLYREDIAQIKYRISELHSGMELVQKKLNSMEMILENKI